MPLGAGADRPLPARRQQEVRACNRWRLVNTLKIGIFLIPKEPVEGGGDSLVMVV